MRTPRLAVLLILGLAVPSLARAVQVQATSSTQYLWYDDFLSQKAEQADLAEYLRLNALSLDKDGKINFFAYGRVVGQLKTMDEQLPELWDNVGGRLYYAFLDYRDVVKGHLDLQAGRTYVPNITTPATLDGLYLNGRALGVSWLGATAFGGRRVIFDKKAEIGGIDDDIAGGSVYIDAAKRTHLEVGYARTWASGDLAREDVAAQLDTTPFDFLNLTGKVKYDLVSSRASEITARAAFSLLEGLTLRGEYLDTRPTFDNNSFYRFFNVDDYKQLAASAEYRFFKDRYRVDARIAAEDFDRDESGTAWEAGLYVNPIDALTARVSYEHHDGFTSRLNGVRANAAYSLSIATLQAGIDYDDYRDDDVRDDNATRYWLGGQLRLSKVFAVSARAQLAENYLFNKSYQGFVALDVNL